MMRIAIMSDIHANLPALQAVLTDIKSLGVDQVLNLGDILYGPLWPRETYELLQTNPAVTIQGNQDREIYRATESDPRGQPILRYTVEELGAEGVQWLRCLPETTRTGHIFLCHGTPESDSTYLLEEVNSGEACLRDDSGIMALIGDCPAPVIACGHSHIARAVRLSTGQMVVNPGSVGLPAYSDGLPVKHRMQSCSPDASYAIMENTDHGWAVTFRRVPYDHVAAARRARQLGCAESKVWAAWLETGRASH